MVMYQIFHLIDQFGLGTNDGAKSLLAWDSEALIKFVTDAYSPNDLSTDGEHVDFGFIANGQLSGDPFPCGAENCRLGKIDELARFAALYSDKVLIHHPFEKYSGKNEFNEDNKKNLFTDILLLNRIRPLVESGLVGFSGAYLHYCKDCSQDLEKIPNSVVAKRKEAEELLSELCLSHMSLAVSKRNGKLVFQVTAENVLPHPIYRVSNYSPEYDTLGISEGTFTTIQKNDPRFQPVAKSFFDVIATDLGVQDYYSRKNGFGVITDRPVDLEVLSRLGKSDFGDLASRIVRDFQHALPFVANVPLDHLVDLRREEGEAFACYRDAFNGALKTMHLDGTADLKQLFGDVIRPELNKINLTVKNGHKLLTADFRESLIINSGIVSVGLFAGFLPETARAFMTAVGGVKMGHDLLAKLNGLQREPASIRDSKYYFLWRVAKSQSESKKN